jgi:hypothetical protein
MAEKPELTTAEVKEYLKPLEGRDVFLNDIRSNLEIKQGSKAWNNIRNILFQLSEQGIVKPSGKRDGGWKVIKTYLPVSVFGVVRERRPLFKLNFPHDCDTDLELPIADHAIIREGDLILIGGESNYGKTTLSLNFMGENIIFGPVLMGNEFTHLVGEDGKEPSNEPTPRFLNRMDVMSQRIHWTDDAGQDRFTLLPVREDFAEHIVKNKINIIDWINLESGEHYLIGNLLDGIKSKLGRGIGIVVLQKNKGADSARGGQFTKDFCDLELLIDSFGKLESRITVGKCKESKGLLTGRSWAFSIFNAGTEIRKLREVTRCWECHGKGFGRGGECPNCGGLGWLNSRHQEEYAEIPYPDKPCSKCGKEEWVFAPDGKSYICDVCSNQTVGKLL